MHDAYVLLNPQVGRVFSGRQYNNFILSICNDVPSVIHIFILQSVSTNPFVETNDFSPQLEFNIVTTSFSHHPSFCPHDNYGPVKKEVQ